MALHNDLTWAEGVTRVPYWLYNDDNVAKREQAAIFEGPVWSFLCLEAEVPNPGDYATTFVGEAPVIVARDLDGNIQAFENRCAHRGALLCFKSHGNAKQISCIYHNWTYDLKGNLTGVTFQKGIKGKGGMPPEFDRGQHALRRLHVGNIGGILFGTFSDKAPALETYLGPEIVGRIKRVMRRPVKVLGYFDQALPNNWKIYMENVKDPYHASLLHTFFTTFRINRLSQPGGIIIDAKHTGHHVSYSMIEHGANKMSASEYDKTELRARKENYRLADPSVLDGVDEFGDGITLQILSVFPNFILQQIQNALAVRKVLPQGLEKSNLVWTHFGFVDDDEKMTQTRIKQSNLVGPAGFISMEDGVVGGFVQRTVPGAGGRMEVVEMGGHEMVSQDTRATEAPLRGYWKMYRELMAI
ncbi:MAG: Rieske 2Fe-2S domain-containing protein [Alphaproteobacteria bacterium]|nr:Rieske 2Fe-2S domain-containing protein [Alphaproteobacteria bacterium]